MLTNLFGYTRGYTRRFGTHQLAYTTNRSGTKSASLKSHSFPHFSTFTNRIPSRSIVNAHVPQETVRPKIFKDAKDYISIEDTDFIEIYCGNAKQAAHWYQSVFGFEPVAYAGLETNTKNRTSYVLRQKNITIVLTSPLNPDGDISDHVKLHGDGVKFVALRVLDSTKAYEEAVRRGATSYLMPSKLSDENGEVIISGIKTYGDTVHLFVERKNYKGFFLPGYREWKRPYYHPNGIDTNNHSMGLVGLRYIDHIVGNVEKGKMNSWAKMYQNVFGMTNVITFDDKDISTQFTALQSKVMSNGTGTIKYPINEPADGLKRSQIQEYLDFYKSPGVQHIALVTDDIVRTVRELRNRGCEFLPIPGTYYDTLINRCGQVDENVQELKELGILVDKDEYGYMLQIFTRPLGDRPTLFIEIIQRKGAHSFGKGNFKALFESIEEEQQQRGTLDK